MRREMAIIITNIRTVCCALQAGCNLTIVRVDTNQPGLYGWGCATFTQRYASVEHVIEHYLKPLMVGRNALAIEDNWLLMKNNAYWRNGPILNNAISGIDQALWDILGKEAGMPIWQLLGGKSRPAVPVYRHVKGSSIGELEEKMQELMEMGCQYFRCQVNGYGSYSYGGCEKPYLSRPEEYPDGIYCDVRGYLRFVPKMFAYLREHVGWDVELLHDSHERLSPIEALQLAKDLEPYKLFFLEDPVAPDQTEWLKTIRSQCSTPIAIGELFNNPEEYRDLIAQRQIDFIRCHISQIGGLTPARKLAAFAETFGVKTAWHGPGDVSPIGHACNVHLSLHTSNTGILEWFGIDQDEAILEVFSGVPQQRGTYVYANDLPGWGIEVNEEKARKYPPDSSAIRWTTVRLPDGGLVTP